MNYRKLKSGTDIRGVACDGVKNQRVELTDEVIKELTYGFILWCKEHLGKNPENLKVVIGRDSRISGERIARAIIEKLLEYGVDVYYTNLSSTPSMFYACLDIPADAAIEVTASHHPFNRNGLKFFTKAGGFESSDIDALIAFAEENENLSLRKEGKLTELDYMSAYSKRLRDMIKEGVNAENYEKPLEGFKITVDAGNGAGGFYAYNVLEKLGADVSSSQFLEPDGMFPNHIPNPENEEAMESIQKAVTESKSDLGIIFDTDVDRCGAVDENGAEINKNSLIALASYIALQGNGGGTVVTDSITSDGLSDFINNRLKGVHHRFKRGYKNVINEAKRLNTSGINAPLAIETSGHAAMRENYFLDDGAYLVTKIIILMAKLRKENKKLGDILKDLKSPAESYELRFDILSENFKEPGENVINKLKAHAEKNNINIVPNNYEGIRLSFDKENGDGWLLLRLSVHDPVMPLNIESNITGGSRIIAGKLYKFFEKEAFFSIDISPLKEFLK